nr:MAG TPA: hypothetical protein [Caudoviricetes sp.]
MTKEEIMEAIEDAEVIDSREIGGRRYNLYTIDNDGTEISVIDNDDANAERFTYVLNDSTQVLKNLDSVEDGTAELREVAEVY